MKYDDIRDFLIEKKIHARCEVCGQDKGWSVRGSTGPDGTYKAFESLAYADPSGSEPYGPIRAHGLLTVVIECGHCGNLRLFAHKVVNDWVLAKRAAIKIPNHSEGTEVAEEGK